MREANRDLLARRPGTAVNMPERDQAVTVTDELLGFGVGIVEGAAGWTFAGDAGFASSLGFMVWVVVAATYLLKR